MKTDKTHQPVENNHDKPDGKEISDQEADTVSSHGIDYNPDDYRHHIEKFNHTKTKEDELLQVIWNMMAAMVDMGWGVDNIQLMLPDLFHSESQSTTIQMETQAIKEDSPNDT